MRLFVFGFVDRFGILEVISKLKEAGHQIVYWVDDKAEELVDRSQFPDTILHNLSDALQGKPPKSLENLKFPPPGEELIKEFYETESVVMTMMNKKYGGWMLDERRHLYYYFLGYWQAVIKKYQPEAMIFVATPHTVYDLVVYSLAKRFGIKTLMLENPVVDGRLLVLEDYKKGHPGLGPLAYKSAARQSAVADLSHQLQKYYLAQRSGEMDIAPWQKVAGSQPQSYTSVGMRALYSDANSKTAFLIKKMKMVWHSLKDLSFFPKAILFFYKKLFFNLRKEYQSVQSVIDWNKKYIYVPLSYQPERTTCPHGGVFMNQLLMVEVLASVLPPDWLIYVKEHPIQWIRGGPNNYSGYRYVDYYRWLARIKGVRIVPVKTSTYELIKHSQAVATVTGTAAWEAILRSRPALIFGYFWFQNAPGVFQVRDAESARAAMEKIRSGFQVDQKEVLNYLAVFEKESFPGFVDAYGEKISKMSLEENTAGISGALLSRLN